MPKKTKTAVKADKSSLKRIVIDLKPDEHEKLKRAAEADLMPVKGAARNCLLRGLSMLSEKRGQKAFDEVPTGEEAIKAMPF